VLLSVFGSLNPALLLTHNVLGTVGVIVNGNSPFGGADVFLDKLDFIECFETSGQQLRVCELPKKQKEIYCALGIDRQPRYELVEISVI